MFTSPWHINKQFSTLLMTFYRSILHMCDYVRANPASKITRDSKTSGLVAQEEEVRSSVCADIRNAM